MSNRNERGRRAIDESARWERELRRSGLAVINVALPVRQRPLAAPTTLDSIRTNEQTISQTITVDSVRAERIANGPTGAFRWQMVPCKRTETMSIGLTHGDDNRASDAMRMVDIHVWTPTDGFHIGAVREPGFEGSEWSADYRMRVLGTADVFGPEHGTQSYSALKRGEYGPTPSADASAINRALAADGHHVVRIARLSADARKLARRFDGPEADEPMDMDAVAARDERAALASPVRDETDPSIMRTVGGSKVQRVRKADRDRKRTNVASILDLKLSRQSVLSGLAIWQASDPAERAQVCAKLALDDDADFHAARAAALAALAQASADGKTLRDSLHAIDGYGTGYSTAGMAQRLESENVSA